ncbi:MAG: hypothetical protein PHI97_23495 [Desulfobulbus sp.]|nr:hypothetical protein [Desulfobulbus sp.]
MKTLGLLVCLTLLIAPALTAIPRTCTVISTTEDTITLQCAGNGHTQVNDQVRLQTVNK